MKAENKEVFISAADLRGCTPEELEAVIAETKQKLLDLRTEQQFRPARKPHLFQGYKKLIARAQTILNEMK